MRTPKSQALSFFLRDIELALGEGDRYRPRTASGIPWLMSSGFRPPFRWACPTGHSWCSFGERGSSQCPTCGGQVAEADLPRLLAELELHRARAARDEAADHLREAEQDLATVAKAALADPNISADRIRQITGVSVGDAYRIGGTDGIDAEALLDQMDALMFDGPCSQPLPDAEAARLREHIAALLQEHQLTMREEQIRWHDACAHMDTREIVVRPVDCKLGYFVALHEIGHFVLGLASDDGGRRLYDSEAAVDEWAVDTAVVAPSADAEQKLIKFLITDDPGPGRDEAPGRVSAACARRRQRDASDEKARRTTTST